MILIKSFILSNKLQQVLLSWLDRDTGDVLKVQIIGHMKYFSPYC